MNLKETMKMDKYNEIVALKKEEEKMKIITHLKYRVKTNIAWYRNEKRLE